MLPLSSKCCRLHLAVLACCTNPVHTAGTSTASRLLRLAQHADEHLHTCCSAIHTWQRVLGYVDMVHKPCTCSSSAYKYQETWYKQSRAGGCNCRVAAACHCPLACLPAVCVIIMLTRASYRNPVHAAYVKMAQHQTPWCLAERDNQGRHLKNRFRPLTSPRTSCHTKP